MSRLSLTRGASSPPEPSRSLLFSKTKPRKGDLEFTPTGLLRSEKEVEGIRNAKIKKRQKLKKESKDAFDAAQKAADLEKRKSRKDKRILLDYTANSSDVLEIGSQPTPVEKAWTKKKKKEEVRTGWIEPSVLRAFNERKKAMKKNAKKERQAKRRAETSDIKTESSVEAFPLSQAFSHLNMKFVRTFAESLTSEVDIYNPSLSGPLKLGILLHQLIVSKNGVSDTAALVQYMMSENFDQDTIVAVTTASVALLVTWRTYAPAEEELKKDGIYTESLAEIFFDGSRFFSTVLQSQAATAIRDLFLMLTSYQFFSKDVSKKVSQVFGAVPKCSVLESLEILFRSIASLIQMGELLLSGTPFSSLFMAEDPLHTALTRARTLILQVDRIYYGLPAPGYTCAKTYLSEVTEVRDVLMMYFAKVSPNTPKGKLLAEVLPKISSCINTASSMLNRKLRPAPIAIVLHGSPGIGKASLLEFIATLHSKVKGRVYDSSHMYNRVPTSNYWDGYSPFSTPYIHYSELGSMTSSMAKVRGDPVIQELTSVIDNVPLCLDMSSVDDKGKVFCQAEMVLIDTNNPKMNLDVLVNNPSAYMRRFIYIEPIVRPEYKNDHGPGIDKAKCNDGKAHFDRYTFTVRTHIPVGLTATKVQDHLEKDKDDIYHLTSLLNRMFTEHIDSQERHTKDSSDIDMEPYMRYCPEEKEMPHSEVSRDDVDYFWAYLKSIYHLHAPHYWGMLCIMLGIFNDACLAVLFGLCSYLGTTPWFYSLVVHTVTAILFPYLIYSFIHFSISWNLLLWLVIFVSYNEHRTWVKTILKSYAAKQNLHYRSLVQSKIRDYKMFIGECVGRDAFKLPSGYGKYMLFCGGFFSFCMAYQFLFKKPSAEYKTQVSTFVDPEPISAVLNEYEEKFACSKSYKRVPVKDTKVWNTIEVIQSSHVSDTTSLARAVDRNVRQAVIEGGGARVRTFVTGVRGNYALINEHSIYGMGEKLTFRVNTAPGACDGHMAETTVYLSDCPKVCSDILLVKLGQIAFSDILKHFPEDDIMFGNCHGYIQGDKVLVNRVVGNINVEDKNMGVMTLHKPVTYKWENHSSGKCGAALVANRDSGSCIVGIHVAGHKSSSASFAIHVLRNQIKAAMEKASMINPRAEIFSEVEVVLGGQEPHPKSPICYEYLENISYFGFSGSHPNINQKTHLRRTLIAGELEEKFTELLGLAPEKRYVPPMMKPQGTGESFISPYNIGIRKMDVAKRGLDPHIMNKVIVRLHRHIVDSLDEVDLELAPLDVESAINGVMEDCFVRRMDVNKAAGYGTPGKKSKYFTRTIVEGKTVDEPLPTIKEELVEEIKTYLNGQMVGNYYKAQLKDEPRSKEKAESGATRLFFSSPLVPLILQRMFLGPFYSLMVEKGDIFRTAIGIDMHRDAGRLKAKISRFNNYFEGDFKGFDTSMPFDIGHAANTVALLILERYGYSEEAMIIASGLLCDNLFPFVVILEEVLRVVGLQPSGKGYTAEDNSLRNLIILMYCWYSIDELEDMDFFEHVESRSYGDDLFGTVSDEAKMCYNNLAIADVCQKHLGMEFTAADKSVNLTPFVKEEDITFLKRRFVLSKHLRKVVAPLEVDSLYKTLEWTLPSNSVNAATQMIQSASSVLRELMFHVGEKEIMQFREWLGDSISRHYELEEASVLDQLPTYYALADSLLDETQIPMREGRWVDTDFCTEAQYLWSNTYYNDYLRYRLCSLDRELTLFLEWSNNEEVIQELLNSLINEQKQLEDEVESLSCPCPGMGYRKAQKMKAYKVDAGFRLACDTYYLKKDRLDAIISTSDKLYRWIQSHKLQTDFQTESDRVEMSSGSIDDKVISSMENVTDVSGNAPDEKEAGYATSLRTGQSNLLRMDNFLDRPVALATYTITPGADLTVELDPWTTFMAQPSVRSKLRNYAFLRGNLNVRLTISGTPFHYGRVQVSYQPLAAHNRVINYHIPRLGTDRRFQSLCYLSQAPGCAVLDVKDNKPLDMVCPFISPAPMVRLFNTSPLIMGESTPFDDVTSLGKMYINTINQVGCTAPSPSNVSMFVYAWMTEVEVGAPTGTILTIGTEAGRDEREIGPVERIATRASEIAYALTSIPVIQPFAKASGMALEGIGSLAALFGYSVPTMINEPHRIKREAFQNGAQVIGYDTGKRITLDPKQELSVDPRVVGTSDDEMSISFICARESLLDTFVWSPLQLPLVASIWNCPVNPRVAKVMNTTIPSNKVVQPTALGFAAAPFEYWRGDITFRLEIVCSAYHRGKLAVYFEPNVAQSVLIDTDLEMNKQYMKIIDIQETQSVEFCVQWAFPKPWARVMPNNLLTTLGSIGTLGPDLMDFANGYIGVVPFTALQSPDDSPVSINVYISSTNIRFNHLCAANMPTSMPVTEADRSYPHEVDCMALNPSSATMDYICEEYFGESPVSFRALCKRFTTTKVSSSGGSGSYFVYVQPVLPFPNPTFQGTNFANPNLLGYLRYAYVGLRGGLKKRLFLAGNWDVSPMQFARVSSTGLASGSPPNIATFGNTDLEVCSRMDGTVSYIPRVDSGFEFELPFYSNNSFAISFSEDPYPPLCTLINPRAARNYRFSLVANFASTQTKVFEDTAIGEDFSFMRFQGAPPFGFI
nr:MAG: polyprotein [Marnaviridae sp.]